MKIVKVKDYADLSKYAADYFIKKIRVFPTITLGFATGSTPEGMYQLMIKDHLENGTSYRTITTFNLDEYIGLDEQDPNSYRFFMDQHLFNHLDIEKSNTYIPRGHVIDLKNECDTYEQHIKEKGGIDLLLLGIGGNGHIGFNEPGSAFQSRTRMVELTEKTRIDNARFFDNIEDVPTQAITMGIATIMESKEIVLLASGEGKREAIKMLLSGNIMEDFPSSILNKHPNVTIIADEEALKDVSKLSCLQLS